MTSTIDVANGISATGRVVWFDAYSITAMAAAPPTAPDTISRSGTRSFVNVNKPCSPGP